MTTPATKDRNENKLALQMAGWLPFDPGTMTRMRDFDLARTQAAQMAGGVAGLVRECRAQSWREFCNDTPKARAARSRTIWLTFALRTHFVVAQRVENEILIITAKPSALAFWLAGRSPFGLRLSKRLTSLEIRLRTMRLHWKIFRQLRQAT